MNGEEVKMDERKLTSIRDWPVPNSIRDIQSFKRFCNFYRRFIYRFSEVAKPLTDYVRKE